MHLLLKYLFGLICLACGVESLKCVTCATVLGIQDCINDFPPPQECAVSGATHCNKILSYRNGGLESVMRLCTDAKVIEECANIPGASNVTVCQYFCDWDGCNESVTNRQVPSVVISTVFILFLLSKICTIR